MAKIRLRKDAIEHQADRDVPDHVAMALAQAGLVDRLDEQGNVIDTGKVPEGRQRMRLKRTLQEGAVIEVSSEAAALLESSGLAAHPGASDTNAQQMEPRATIGVPHRPGRHTEGGERQPR